MANSFVLAAAFIVSVIYLYMSYKKSSARAVAQESKLKKPVRQESSRSAQLRRKFAIPEEGGKVAISIDKKYFVEKFEKAYRGLNEAITAFNEACKVFLIVQSNSDEEERQIAAEVREKVPALKQEHRLLHYEQPLGKIAFIRQIIPHLLIEFDDEMVNKLLPHIPNVIKHNLRSTSSGDRITVVDSLMELLDGVN